MRKMLPILLALVPSLAFGQGAARPSLPDPVRRTYLAAPVTETDGAAYTTIFTVPLVMVTGKTQIVRAVLAQQSSVDTVGIQNRARITGANVTGLCRFETMTSATGMEFDMIAVATTPADTGPLTSVGSAAGGVPNVITCVLTAANTTATSLVIDFQAETVGTVTTLAGSYVEHSYGP